MLGAGELENKKLTPQWCFPGFLSIFQIRLKKCLEIGCCESFSKTSEKYLYKS